MCNATIEELSQTVEESAEDESSSIGDDIPQLTESYGSSLGGAIFNFTNCIVGAGAIGLGGAFAESGGLISIATIIFFALLTKSSLDLVVIMSVENSQPLPDNPSLQRSATYEELGFLAFGRTGAVAVLLSKFLYSFGCLVAYIIVVKDNFTPALQHFLYGNGHHDAWFNKFLLQDGAEDTVTWFLGAFVILPLCLLRDMTPLSSLGAVSISLMCFIVLIVTYIFVAEPEVHHKGGGTYENWIQIRPGYVESWGTFVFTFVSQHTVNLAFESLKPEIRTIGTWKKVSSWSLLMASFISLTVGLVVYMTFWQDTQSDLFDMYPPMRIVDLAKLLLCVTMLLTFPLPFFSCRELLIVSLIRPLLAQQQRQPEQHTLSGLLMEPFLRDDVQTTDELLEPHNGNNVDSTSVIFEDAIRHRNSNALCHKIASCYSTTTDNFFIMMMPGEEKQLSVLYHVALSVLFWGGCTFLALESPNLGDILNLVGSATGTSMAFILPGLLSFKLQGYTRLAAFILALGGAIGFVGTIYSLEKLIEDIKVARS